jgi:poly-gamma-glutamate synthesis protein (capsule biosynthesis protein)
MKIKMLVSVFVFFILGLLNPWNASAAEEPITVTAVGDCIISNKISYFKDPQFLKLVEILRAADCAYGNCETTFFRPEDGFPAYKDFDPNVFCYPWGADEIKWLGIDLMSTANNHIMDFDYNGLFATLKHLDRVGIAHAGAGKDLEQASRAGYFETAKGPVALVSCSSWLPEPNHQATLPHPYMNGKPGLNPINVEFVLQLDKENFAKLKEVRDTAMKALNFPMPKEEKGKEVTKIRLEESTFTKGDRFELQISANKKDMERIYADIKIARRNARLVIVSQHEHLGLWPEKAPSKFQEKFARACIDAGADMFVGTGSHELWPVEIYKGKPIFYSIGNFLFQGPLRVIAPEAYQRADLPLDNIKDPTVYEDKFATYFSELKIPIWESVVPIVTFDGKNKVTSIELHPIDLLEKEAWYKRGTPRLADKKQAESIIKRLKEMSKRYKTKIKYENGIGRIAL